MAASVSQHRKFHGIILKEFLEEAGIEPTKENIDTVKQMFKKYLRLASVSALDDSTYGRAISAVTMLISREFGIEVPHSFAEKTMTQILTEATRNYEKER